MSKTRLAGSVLSCIILLVLLVSLVGNQPATARPFPLTPYGENLRATTATRARTSVGSAWRIKVPDYDWSNGEISLAIDVYGLPHISYSDIMGKLKYVFHNGTEWVRETVDPNADVSIYGTSLALDADGYPHISYLDWEYTIPNQAALKHAYQDATGWHIEVVDSGGKKGADSSIAIDALGYPHISYYDIGSRTLNYAWYDGTSWSLRTVDSGGYDAGYRTSLALDPMGRPHISYAKCNDGLNDDLMYAYYDGTSWHREIVRPHRQSYLGLAADIAVDSAGRPHIIYPDGWDDGLTYASYDGVAWQFEIIAPSGGGPSLVLDTADRPHIAFRAPGWLLGYAYNDGTSWQIQTIENSGKVYFDSALALDPTGQPGIGYLFEEQPSADKFLKYACEGCVFLPPPPNTRLRYGSARVVLDDSVMVGEADHRVTIGDHVNLRLHFTNYSTATITDTTITLVGARPSGYRPGLLLATASQGWSRGLDYSLGSMGPGETRTADVWIYVERLDPSWPRSSLTTYTYLEVQDGLGGEIFPIHVEEVYFAAGDYQELTVEDCLHHPNDFPLAAYAQYAAGDPEGPIPISQNPNSHDPDWPDIAVQNVVANVNKEFLPVSTTADRVADTLLLTSRGEDIGECRHYADLTIGLLRSLNIPTRWAAGIFFYPNWSGGPNLTTLHAWAESYLPDQSGWRQADSAWGFALDESIYYDSGLDVLWAWAEKYPLATASSSHMPQYRCISACYESGANCSTCLEESNRFRWLWEDEGSSCVDDIASRYGGKLATAPLTASPAAGEALLLRPQAPIGATRGVPQTLTVGVANSTTTVLAPVTITLATREYVSSSLVLYDVAPPMHVLPNLLPGATITVTWVVTPLVTAETVPLYVSAIGGGRAALEGTVQKVNEPGTLPDLTLAGTCVGGPITPGQPVTLSAVVLNEVMAAIPNATVVAVVHTTPTLGFSVTAPLTYCSACQRYQYQLTIPITAPLGTYQVNLAAEHAGYDATGMTTFFHVAPTLTLALDANSSILWPQSRFTLTVGVRDRGATAYDADVWAVIATSIGTVTVPLLNEDYGLTSRLSFQAADLAANLGGVYPAGRWNIAVMAEYQGGYGRAELEVIAYQANYRVYLPVVIRDW